MLIVAVSEHDQGSSNARNFVLLLEFPEILLLHPC